MGIFVWGIGWTLYYFIHSLLASEGIEKKLYSLGIGKACYRISYNIVAIMTLLPLILYYPTLPSKLLFEFPVLQFLGGFSILCGGILTLLALKNYDLLEFIGWRYLDNAKTEQGDELNTSGLNALVRHPLYFAALLIFWGLFLFKPELKILIMTLITHVYLLIGIRLEEQKLIQTFGTAYLNYRKKTPKLFPFKIFHKTEK